MCSGPVRASPVRRTAGPDAYHRNHRISGSGGGVASSGPKQESIAVNRGEPVSRGHRRQFDGEHRNVKGRNTDVSIGDTALRYPAGAGNPDRHRVPAPNSVPGRQWCCWLTLGIAVAVPGHT